MNIFKKENKNDILEKDDFNNYSIMEMNNYMLTDIRSKDIKSTYTITLSDLAKVSNIGYPTVQKIKTIIDDNKKVNDRLFKITNLEANESLKSLKDGQSFWGAIKKSDGTSKMAKLKEVEEKGIILDPTVMMMSVTLSAIENELADIKEISKQILTFLEHEKESEIESDLEILNRSINDFKYNLNDEKYLINNHKQVMDIKRTSNKNILFYKKEINEIVKKEKIIMTNGNINSIIDDIQNKFRYLRLSLYIYSFSTLMEILLLGNYNSNYLISKVNELNELNNEYKNIFNKALNYIKINANKSLESNLLSGLSSASKAISSLAEKVKVKNVDNWLNERGSNLQKTSQNMKESYNKRFDEIKDNNTSKFINKIEEINCIYNNTKEIYFDNENVYLEM